MNGGMKDPPGLSPWNFNNLNSYDPTKDFMLNAQIHLRDPNIEICKGGQVEEN